MRKFIRMVKLFKNYNLLHQLDWEIEGVHKVIVREKKVDKSPIELTSLVYEYAYLRAIINRRPLENVFLERKYREFSHGNCRDSQYSNHKWIFELNGFFIEFQYEFQICPSFNMVGDNAIYVNYSDFKGMQASIKVADMVYDLLEEEQNVKEHLSFKPHIPEELRTKFSSVYDTLQEKIKEELSFQQESENKRQVAIDMLMNMRTEAMSKVK